ncbi:MAG: hypothetical protein Athens071424_99 [Parcubacteria group bacterium Athens0714_24]|nr:MAG: hypothetical protein Athens071424_99 [Parcubacteria group bacterium Athens0714_24]
MEKEYQYLPCPDCNITLRLTISKKNYGRIVEVTCPTCGAKCQTVIVDKKKIAELAERMSSAVTEALSESTDFLWALQALREAGFGINLALIGEIAPISQQSPKPVQPKVREDGKIELGTFSSEDENWAKKFKIKLDD